MSKKKRFTVKRPLAQFSDDELGSLIDSVPPYDKRFLPIKQELERRLQQSKEKLQRLEQVVQQDTQGLPRELQADTIWYLWPAFVEEVYTIHPERLEEIEQVINAYMHWLITNKEYAYHLSVGYKAVTEWMRDVVRMCVGRRIMQWKYILFTEHGRDTFASAEERDDIVHRVKSGQFVIGQ